MGITIGDALTVVSIVAALAFSLWATSLLVGMLFEGRSQRAMKRVAEAPGRTFGLGLVGGLAWVSVAIVLNSVPNPLSKLLALGVMGLLGCVAALGISGIARLVAQRIVAADASFSPFLALVRGSTFVVLAMMMPLLGWFFIGPVLTVIGIGAGIHGLTKAKVPAIETTTEGV